MKRVLYAGGAFVTGDRIADAVLDYAAVLAGAGASDHVRVPGLGADHLAAEFDVVIGPASQLFAERAGLPDEELVDDDFVGELERRSQLAAAGRAEQIGRAILPGHGH